MYKIVCVTPSGRRRYMKYLIPQIISSPIVDRYDIWLNTELEDDIVFLESLAKMYSKINIVYQPDGVINGNKSINAFFKKAIDEDTIYIRLDDDVLWIEPDFFEKMVEFRTKNREFFLVSPMIINNAICSYILQHYGKLSYNKKLTSNCFDLDSWVDADFALKLHKQFLNKIEEGTTQSLYVPHTQISLNRFSINSVCWFGSEFKKFDGLVLGDEEEYISTLKPMELNKINSFAGNILISHFAFFTQRKVLDTSNLLTLYEKMIDKTYARNQEYVKIKKYIFGMSGLVEDEFSLKSFFKLPKLKGNKEVKLL
jgi:hypothetical protein